MKTNITLSIDAECKKFLDANKQLSPSRLFNDLIHKHMNKG